MTGREQVYVSVRGLTQLIEHVGDHSPVSAFGNWLYDCIGRKPLDPQQCLRRSEPLTDPFHYAFATLGIQQREFD
jgi:hypothetical protein